MRINKKTIKNNKMMRNNRKFLQYKKDEKLEIVFRLFLTTHTNRKNNKNSI